MQKAGIRRSQVCSGLMVATLLTFAGGCGGEANAPDESSVGQTSQALTRGPWDFEGDALDTYTRADAEADFGPLYGWDTSNLITVASTNSNEYLRVKLPSSTEDQGAKFTPYLWSSGEYPDTTVQWQIYFEPGWDFYDGDVKLGGVGGGRNYTGGDGDEAKNNCDGWNLRFILHGNGSPNNKVKAYYYGCDMAGTPSNGVLYGNVLGSGCTITSGEWYTLVVSVRANSSGMSNGRLRMWLKRNADPANVCTVASSDNRKFANDTAYASWHENYPRYWSVSLFRGGAGTPPAEDHYVRMDVIKWNNYFYDTYPF